MPADGGLLREAPVALDALRSLPGGAVLVFDRDLRFVLASGGAITQHGYTPEDLEGRFCAEVLPAGRWATYEPLYVAALRGEESAVELDTIDGAARFMVEIGPLRDEAGDVIGGVMISRDVTAVRRLEAEVRLREQLAGHLAAVVDSSGDAIISKTPDGMIVSWNRGAESLYGYSEAEVKGKSISIIVPGGREEEFATLLARAAAGERVEQFETVRRRKDGSLLDVALTISAMHNSDGLIVGASVIARDITEQKQAERELAEARRDIDRFFDLSLDVMAIANDKGHFVRVNPAFQDTLGYSRQDLTGRPFADFVHPDDLQSTLQLYAELLAGTPAIAFENRYLCKDGTFRWLLWNATAIEDGFLYCTARDITERKALEQSVHEAEALLALSFDHSPLGMSLTLPDRTAPRINLAFAQMLGYTVEELRAMEDPEQIIHPDDLATDQDHVRALLDGNANAAQFEKRYIHADGHTVSALVSVSLLRHPDGALRVLIAQIEDITERKRMEQRLRQLADHDSLTGLRNRRSFEEAMILQVGRCQRYREKASLLLIDLDNFKQINDTHGHKTGDDVLKAVAVAISERVRQTDIAARIGGDEFAVLLPHTSNGDAVAVARAIERMIAEATVDIAGVALHQRASIGVAAIDATTPHSEFALAAADHAMYAAKRRKPHRKQQVREPSSLVFANGGLGGGACKNSFRRLRTQTRRCLHNRGNSNRSLIRRSSVLVARRWIACLWLPRRGAGRMIGISRG